MSYRGFYDELAIEYRISDYERPTPSVGELLAQLQDCVGRVFHGYKGGEFTMSRDTPVWVANSSEACGTFVRGVQDDEWCVRILTGLEEE